LIYALQLLFATFFELQCKFTDQAGSGIDTSDMYFRAAELMS